MQKINVFVADSNEELVSSVKKQFSNHAVIEVTDYAFDGETALKTILKNPNKYDIIMIDVILKNMDGIELIKELKKSNVKSHIIVASSYNGEDTIHKLASMGVEMFLLKPYSKVSLENRIMELLSKDDLIHELPRLDLNMAISKLLHSLGVPSHIKGYLYVRDGIYMMYDKKEMVGGITKIIYPSIANKYDTTSSRVERAIRHAIEVSWSRGDYDLMEEIFGHSVDYDKAKPTNSEFIATLADRLRIDKKIFNN